MRPRSPARCRRRGRRGAARRRAAERSALETLPSGSASRSRALERERYAFALLSAEPEHDRVRHQLRDVAGLRFQAARLEAAAELERPDRAGALSLEQLAFDRIRGLVALQRYRLLSRRLDESACAVEPDLTF